MTITVVLCIAFNNMAGGKIQLFHYVQKYYRMIGICPPSKPHQQPSFNVENTLSLISLTLGFVFSFAFFLFESDSIVEYGRSCYGSISNLELVLYFIFNFSQIQNISALIRKFEHFIETSELIFIIE